MLAFACLVDLVGRPRRVQRPPVRCPVAFSLAAPFAHEEAGAAVLDGGCKSVSLLALVPFADHSAVSRPIEADVQRPKHGENVLALDPELIAYIGQLDLPLGLRGTLLVRHDGGAVNPRVGDEPAVRTGRELRLRKV